MLEPLLSNSPSTETFVKAVFGGAWSTDRTLHYLAFFISGCTVLLLCAGALVTSTGSGLAVPDWPLSFGQFFPEMVGGVLFEHGHRLVAGLVAILILSYAIFAQFCAPRAVRRLAWAAVVMVMAQAGLGGLTVLFKLPTGVSVAHACLAQAFFCVVVSITLMTSSLWNRSWNPLPIENASRIGSLRSISLFVVAAFFVQLLLGATMRHRGAGLAIPDFPLVFGGIIPPVFNFSIGIHLAHRIWAAVVSIAVICLVVQIYRRLPYRLDLAGISGALATAVSFQILLGAFTVWLRKPVVLTMLHLAIGAICLSLSVVIALLLSKMCVGFSFMEQLRRALIGLRPAVDS